MVYRAPMTRYLVLFVALLVPTVSFGQEVDLGQKFAPGVVTVIPPQPVPDETFTGPVTLRELIRENPDIEWTGPDFPDARPYTDAQTRTLAWKSRNVTFRREVYGFEFAFKPMRQMMVDVPQPNGVMKRKLIWYLVFRLRYIGGDLRPKGEPDQYGNMLYEQMEKVGYASRRCFPLLVLSNTNTGKEYTDRIIPAARDRIAAREKISPLYNTVEITSVAIPRVTEPSDPGYWCVATWEDVDPQIDFFSVNVYGLTNGRRHVEVDGQDLYQKKVLQLNFFRPGDTIDEPADRIRFGVPAFSDEEEQAAVLKQLGIEERVDYLWTFR